MLQFRRQIDERVRLVMNSDNAYTHDETWGGTMEPLSCNLHPELAYNSPIANSFQGEVALSNYIP